MGGGYVVTLVFGNASLAHCSSHWPRTGAPTPAPRPARASERLTDGFSGGGGLTKEQKEGVQPVWCTPISFTCYRFGNRGIEEEKKTSTSYRRGHYNNKSTPHKIKNPPVTRTVHKPTFDA